MNELLEQIILEARIWGICEERDEYYDTETIDKLCKELKELCGTSSITI